MSFLSSLPSLILIIEDARLVVAVITLRRRSVSIPSILSLKSLSLSPYSVSPVYITDHCPAFFTFLIASYASFRSMVASLPFVTASTDTLLANMENVISAAPYGPSPCLNVCQLLSPRKPASHPPELGIPSIAVASSLVAHAPCETLVLDTPATALEKSTNASP